MDKRKQREGEEYHALLHPELYMVPKKRKKGDKGAEAKAPPPPPIVQPEIKAPSEPASPQPALLESTTQAAHQFGDIIAKYRNALQQATRLIQGTSAILPPSLKAEATPFKAESLEVGSKKRGR